MCFRRIKIIESLKNNDEIRCGFNLITNEIFFTNNGKLIRKTFNLMWKRVMSCNWV